MEAGPRGDVKGGAGAGDDVGYGAVSEVEAGAGSEVEARAGSEVEAQKIKVLYCKCVIYFFHCELFIITHFTHSKF